MRPAHDNSMSDMPQPTELVRHSGVFYGAISAIGIGIMLFFHHTFPSVLAMPAQLDEGLRWLAVGAIAAALLLILSYFFEDWFPSFRDLKSSIVQMIGPLSWPAGVYLALISSVGEELLFRGAIQPFAGLWLTAALFGLLHMGPAPVSAWSLWAMLAGLMLGWLSSATASLWPPILAHFIVNLVSILSLRRAWHKIQDHLASTEEPAKVSATPHQTSHHDD